MLEVLRRTGAAELLPRVPVRRVQSCQPCPCISARVECGRPPQHSSRARLRLQRAWCPRLAPAMALTAPDAGCTSIEPRNAIGRGARRCWKRRPARLYAPGSYKNSLSRKYLRARSERLCVVRAWRPMAAAPRSSSGTRSAPATCLRARRVPPVPPGGSTPQNFARGSPPALA